MKSLLGGKGANLAEMSSLEIPVPPGFTISTEVCKYFYENSKEYPKELKGQIASNLEKLEKELGKKLGDSKNPLLVSVRSGAAVSMPGMMDTVLNLGLNDDVVEGLIKLSDNPRFVWDAYRRFIQMFGDVVMGIAHDKFEHALDSVKKEKGVHQDTELDADDLMEVVKRYKKLYKKEIGKNFPQDSLEQLNLGIDAVVGSWNNKRAIEYRRINKIDEDEIFGTAVNVQAMVFGNMGDDSGTGVAFTRNPATGEKKYYGEYLMNAQGEDVVAGIRTPEPIAQLQDVNPEVYKELTDIFEKLEKHYKDMQDMEFTIQEGKLYLLQTRTGKRTAAAAVKIAVDMVSEKMIDKETAVMRIPAEQIDQLLHPTLDPRAEKEVIAKALPASPGAATGQIVFTPDDATDWKEQGKKVILVRTETSPEDITGMNAAEGILTARGGMTSHAAVVARGMGKCCVAGCSDAAINEKKKMLHIGEEVDLKEGDWLTLDGSTGEVILGKVDTVEPELSGDFAKLMKWADSFRKLGVRTNADTPYDSEVARKFGAEGVGLCRTEHMFFEEDRIFAVRQMILAETLEQREQALAKLLPMQKADFKDIFKVMEGLPVTVRLLDPPLHEFIPHEDEELAKIATEMGVKYDVLLAKRDSLKEFNPMLGHRGCRLGISYPEIFNMQTRAILEAACELKKEKDMEIVPEIMIPLVGFVEELKFCKDQLIKTADEVFEEQGVKVKYKVGTMIEVPRAALTADKMAEEAEFFSFGTNDLTQMGLGFSRDDAGKFIKDYLELGVFKEDPFQTVDQNGVGKLMEMSVVEGRKVRKNLKVGICGEQGGEPKSVEFCHKVGLTYVSCSPYRVPIARLAAAQAALKNK